MEGGPPPTEAAPDPRARRPLNRMLRMLGVLDLTAIMVPIAIVIFGPREGLSPLELLVAVVAGAGAVVATRVELAVRLRRHGAELSSRSPAPKPH